MSLQENKLWEVEPKLSGIFHCICWKQRVVAIPQKNICQLFTPVMTVNQSCWCVFSFVRNASFVKHDVLVHWWFYQILHFKLQMSLDVLSNSITIADQQKFRKAFVNKKGCKHTMQCCISWPNVCLLNADLRHQRIWWPQQDWWKLLVLLNTSTTSNMQQSSHVFLQSVNEWGCALAAESCEHSLKQVSGFMIKLNGWEIQNPCHVKFMNLHDSLWKQDFFFLFHETTTRFFFSL